MNQIFDARCKVLLLLCAVICVFYSRFTTSSFMKQVYYGYQNSDHSVRLIPKRDPGMPGLQIFQSWIPGLKIQSRNCDH